MKKYKLSEVEQHNKAGDLWLAIEGGVYDVSKFAQGIAPFGVRWWF